MNLHDIPAPVRSGADYSRATTDRAFAANRIFAQWLADNPPNMTIMPNTGGTVTEATLTWPPQPWQRDVWDRVAWDRPETRWGDPLAQPQPYDYWRQAQDMDTPRRRDERHNRVAHILRDVEHMRRALLLGGMREADLVNVAFMVSRDAFTELRMYATEFRGAVEMGDRGTLLVRGINVLPAG